MQEGIDFVECRMCGKKFRRITNTHVEKFHSITMKEYIDRFPSALTEVKQLKLTRGKSLRGKTYEEVYGEQEAKQLKERKGKTLTKTYKENKELGQNKSKILKKHFEDKQMKKHLKKSTCKFCGKKFWYNPKGTSGVYCSLKCTRKDRKRVALAFWKTKRVDEKTIKTRIIEERGSVCERCGEEVKNSNKLCLHHLTYDYYSSDTSQYLLLCKSCHVKLHNKMRKEEQGFVGKSEITKAIYQILKSLKIPLDDPNFKNTPGRVSRMYHELCSGLFVDIGEEMKDILSTVFPSDNDEMIIYKGEAAGMCPHHLLPVLYRYYIGIVPKGCVLGASKPQRLVELFCSIPDLQENITTKVKDSITKMLNPQGVFVLIYGEHMCMRVRGVKSASSELTTSAISGCFTKSEARAEFLSIIGK